MKRLVIAGIVLFVAFFCYPASSMGEENPVWAVTTNYSDGAFLPGGKEPHSNWDIPPEGMEFGYNFYPLMCTDAVGVSQLELYGNGDDVEGYLPYWTSKIYPFTYTFTIEESIPKVKENIPDVQMVLNHLTSVQGGEPLTGAVFSVFFPPNFTIDPDNYRYPMVILSPGYGTTGNNHSVFNRAAVEPPNPPETGLPIVPNALSMLTKAYQMNGKGVVVVHWNMGGYHCMGVNSGAREAFGTFISEMHNLYGCNKNQIITLGASRGAFGALTIAENMVYPQDCKTIAVFANSCGLSLGNLAQNPIANQPLFSSRWNEGVGEGASKYNYYFSDTDREPPCENARVFMSTFGNDLTSFEQVNAMCPDYPSNLDKLNGTFIFLSCGTKDGFFPVNYYLDMDRTLSDKGIDHTTFVLIQGTHAGNPNHIRMKVFKEFVRKLFVGGFETESYNDFYLNDWLEEQGRGSEKIPNYTHGIGPDALNYRLFKDLVGFEAGDENFTEIIPLEEPPFIMTIPAHLGCDVFNPDEENHGLWVNEPGTIYLSGASGKTCEITLRNEVDGLPADPVTLTRHFYPGQLTQEIKWWPNCSSNMGDVPGFCERMTWPIFPGGAKSLPNAGSTGYLHWTVSYGDTETGLVDYTAFTNWKDTEGRISLQTEVQYDQPIPSGYYLDPERNYAAASFGVEAVPPIYFVEIPDPPGSGEGWFENVSIDATIGHYMPPTARIYEYSIYMSPKVVGPVGDPEEPIHTGHISLSETTSETLDLLFDWERPIEGPEPGDYLVNVVVQEITVTSPPSPPSATEVFGEDFDITRTFEYTVMTSTP